MSAKKKTTTSDSLSVSIRRSILDDNGIEKLQAVIKSKEGLFRKAFGSEKMDIIVDDEKITFPWFSIKDGTEANAYSTFIEHLCNHAKTLKRVNSKEEKQVENEKYAFRCFLLRLGFVGDQYKETRKVLLSNLAGSSAFKVTPKKEVEA